MENAFYVVAAIAIFAYLIYQSVKHNNNIKEDLPADVVVKPVDVVETPVINQPGVQAAPTEAAKPIVRKKRRPAATKPAVKPVEAKASSKSPEPVAATPAKKPRKPRTPKTLKTTQK